MTAAEPAGDQLELDRGFVFASGIECSAPLVNGLRVDELEKTRHYSRLEEDLELVARFGLRYLRYGIPFHLVNPQPGKFDWSFPDRALGRLRELGITPIVDLMHFGLPDDLMTFQNPNVASRFTAYARAFAERYPWARYYTVVNEPLVTATFSGRFGYWNEQRRDDRSFTRALLTVARCVVLGRRAIEAVRPDALFLQSDSCEYYHPVRPGAIRRANFLNELRFSAFELFLGRRLSGSVADYLLRNGAGRDELGWFEQNGDDSRLIVGNDYYAACEKEVLDDGILRESGERLGYYQLARQYQERLGLPIMQMETNGAEADSVDWLTRQWTDTLRLLQDGVPIRGFTWYGFINHVDWNTSLREPNNHEDPLGLVDLNRQPTPTWAAYRAIIDSMRPSVRDLPLAA
jgi:beta-glucosidase/6-phospho-beta-glucosidase/beta-galactosidase